MAKVDLAKTLAEKGFYVFPLRKNSKLPAIKKFTDLATRDPEDIEDLWRDPDFNIGIATSKYGEKGEALVVIDIDVKENRNGFDSLGVYLEKNGLELPDTYSQVTPSGGKHLFFKYKYPVQGKVNWLKGVDIRSEGNLVVAAGSDIKGKRYIIEKKQSKAKSFYIADLPDHIAIDIGRPMPKEHNKDLEVDVGSAALRVQDYLRTAPQAIEGQAGDITTYKVIASIKDFGLSKESAFEFLQEWDEKNSPPWGEQLMKKIDNVYLYGKRPPGIDAPENQFSEVLKEESDGDYIDQINRDHSLIIGHSKPIIVYQAGMTNYFLSEHTFKTKFANKKISIGDGKTKRAGDLWIESPRRREYLCFDFMPGKEIKDPEVLNLWRGFKTPPLSARKASRQAERAYNSFMHHIFENLCQNDEEKYDWVMTWFAHLVQRPWEKPLTALVIQGEKGTGKNFILDRIGKMIGEMYYGVASSKRLLVGNFNGHLSSKLLFVLDEAFWSGDKGSEGVLKSLITDSKMFVERKGHEPSIENNLMRICIIGNDDWLVPATTDERRFTVLKMGGKRRRDTEFFHEVRVGMDEAGGSQILMDYLKKKKLTSNINLPLETEELADQREQNLDPFQLFWSDCVDNGSFGGTEGWQNRIQKDYFIIHFNMWRKERNMSYWVTKSKITRHLKRMCPSMKPDQKLDGKPAYNFPPLEIAQKEFENFIKGVSN